MNAPMRLGLCLLSLLLGGAPASAEDADAHGMLRMDACVARYAADERALLGFYAEPLSRVRMERLRRFLAGWQERLGARGEAPRALDDAIDLHLLHNHIARRGDELDLQAQRNAQMAPLLPFASGLLALQEGQHRNVPLSARAAAETLTRLERQLESARRGVEAGRAGASREEQSAAQDAWLVSPGVALRSARAVERLSGHLKRWFEFRDGYEPAFGWWVRKPYASLRKALGEYASWLKKTVAGQSDDAQTALTGDAIGRQALCRALARELIPYTPEQLLVIAEREFAWCEAQGRQVAEELGVKDWPAAVEHVKALHREPGEQDELVAAQAHEAIRFLEERELVTLPPLAVETWRLRMLTAHAQKTLPFAVYNDQQMLVAYPTADMSHASKLQTMRGNNEHFTRLVTPHELIPGHHLQLFMARRHQTHRELFRTPFLVEGWALHWEMLLWDLGWHRGPEDRVGMLFWRMHRCARILVTLGFHLGRMQPDAMVALLTDRVGLEKDGATGEVRRYLGGAYGPLYQCAYMVGGLQLRALHHEFVGGGTLSNRQFHDAVLRQGSIPVAMIRAALTGKAPAPKAVADWRFQGEIAAEGASPRPR